MHTFIHTQYSAAHSVILYAVIMRVKTAFCVANKNLVDNDLICMYATDVFKRHLALGTVNPSF